MLIGREKDLQFLKRYYTVSGSQIVVLYGAKGVGKTTLLQEFSHYAGGSAYYRARSCSEREQRLQWAQELTAARELSGQEWTYLTIFQHIMQGSGARKKLIIIDEFQHILKNDATFMPQLVSFLQEHQTNLPCMVLLCTSASGWVENSMIPRIGTYASAIDGLLKIKALKFEDMRQLYPAYSVEDCLMIYAVLGGYPGLWNAFSPRLSARENIIAHLLDRKSRLHGQLSVYIAEELRETAVYNTILSALADGRYKLNDIYERTGFSRAKISVYLKNLMELDLVEKVYSFASAGYENVQKGVYCISNPYVLFYFKYLFPNQSVLRTMDAEDIYIRKILPRFSEDLERTYCMVCREYLQKKYDTIGEWNGKQGKIPILATDAAGNLIACQCSFQKTFTSEQYLHLQQLLQRARLQPDRIILFGENGFSEELLALTEHSSVLFLSLFSSQKG